MLSKTNPIVVGQITGAFGVKGEARVRSFTENPEDCFSYGPLADAAGAIVLTPVKVRPLNEGFGVTTKENRQREEWEALRGTLLHVPREAMPETDAGEVYVADLVGCTVVHADGRALGAVKAVHNFGAGDLIEIKLDDVAETVLMPFTKEFVPVIDVAGGRIVINPPAGLFDETSNDG